MYVCVHVCMYVCTCVCRYGGNVGRSASTFYDMFPKNSSSIPQNFLHSSSQPSKLFPAMKARSAEFNTVKFFFKGPSINCRGF